MKRNYSWKHQPVDERDYKLSLDTTILPKSVDMSVKFPPCYDQSKLGSCTGNAIAGAVHYDLIKTNYPKIFTPSRLFIYYNERVLEGTVTEDSGAIIRDGVKTINTLGVCSEDTWKYDISKFKKKPTKKAFKEALNYQSVEYYAVNQTEVDIKTAIANNFPVIFGFMVKESFESKETATTGVYKPSGKFIGGHAVLIVGYDDSTQQFKVRNSWGTEWGDKGYFYMPYSEVLNTKISSDFWVIKSLEV